MQSQVYQLCATEDDLNAPGSLYTVHMLCTLYWDYTHNSRQFPHICDKFCSKHGHLKLLAISCAVSTTAFFFSTVTAGLFFCTYVT